MVAIGLLDIPPEIHLQIAEFAGTGKALKALSLTSRSLRSIAQSVLFQTLRILLEKKLRGSIDDLLANPRICAAIQAFVLVGPFVPMGRCNYEEKLSLIMKLLPEMVGLRMVHIHRAHISRAFMEVFLERAASTPLRVKLGWNTYPPDINPTLIEPVRISHIYLGYPSHSDHGFYQSVFRASATILTELEIALDEGVLMKLAYINLPSLHDFILYICAENEVSRTSAAAFLTAQRTIRKLVLKGKISPFPALPPDALPDLREVSSSTELVNRLVPGRPLEVIKVGPSPGDGQGWPGEEVGRSTARVRELQLRLNIPTFDIRVVKRIVTVFPFLESLWLFVLDNVCRPFDPLP